MQGLNIDETVCTCRQYGDENAKPAAILRINPRALFSLRARSNVLWLSDGWQSNSSTPLAPSRDLLKPRVYIFSLQPQYSSISTRRFSLYLLQDSSFRALIVDIVVFVREIQGACFGLLDLGEE